MIFFLYLLILSGFIFSRGFFSFNGVFILLAGLILFIITLLRVKLLEIKIISSHLLLLLVSILSLVMYGGLYQQNIILVWLSLILLSLNIFLSLLFIFPPLTQIKRNIFWLMFGIAFLLRLFMIWSSPNPYIDVYDYLQKGALAFLSGQNPYSMTYTKLYSDFTPNYYGYLPGMLFFTLPFVVAFNDPRYAIVTAELMAGIFIYRLAKNKASGSLSVLLLLNNPISLYLVEQSYTEPIVLFLFVAFAYFLAKKRNFKSSILVGILLATKQYAILVIPLVCRLMTSARRCLAGLAISVLVAAIIIMPFFLWNKADFIQDAVFLQYNFTPRYEGLSFFSFLYRFGIDYNFWLSGSIIGLLFIFVYTRKIGNLSSFFYLSSFLYLSFFFFNKWAFINYYYLVSQLLLVGGILKEYKL